jgi:hypothetical protein
MTKLQELSDYISLQLEGRDGPILLLGSVRLARVLHQQHPQIIFGENKLKQTQLSKQAGHLSSMRVDLTRLPFAFRSLNGLVAANVLGRMENTGESLSIWSQYLVPGGLLLLIENVTWSAARAWSKLKGDRHIKLEPEQITCQMLNNGLVGIAQAWPVGRSTIVTFGFSFSL